MKTVNQLLDAIKAKHNLPSDYKLAMYLGVVPGSVKNWRHSRSLPESKVVERIAQELALDPDVLLLEIESQRAASDFAKAAWLRIAQRLQAGAVHVAVLVAVCLVGFTSTPNAEASTLSAAASKDGRLYIMLSRIARYFRALRRSVADTLGGFFGGNNVQSAHPDAAYPYPA